MPELLRSGTDYKVSIGPNAGSLVAVQCETGSTLTVTTEMLETKCKTDVDSDDNPVKTYIAGRNSYTLAVDLNVKLGGSGLDIFEITDVLKSRAKQSFEIFKTGGSFVSGKGLIESQSVQANDNQTMTGSFTLNGTEQLIIEV